MEVVICRAAAEVAALAASKIERVLQDKGPEAVLGVATGSSPVALYQALARSVASGRLDLSRASAFALDEYVGLPPGHPESYAEVIRREVTEPLRMDPARVHTPDGFASDLRAAALAYEAAIRAAGGVDLQVVGVGANGHIGFNEPGSSLASRTRIKTLTKQTRIDNARFFDGDIDQVPTHCITQGLGTIMAARHVVLVASGSAKAEAVHHLAEGSVSALWPATILQHHPHVTVLLDEGAASRLQLSDYYRETYAAKPAWQGL